MTLKMFRLYLTEPDPERSASAIQQILCGSDITSLLIIIRVVWVLIWSLFIYACAFEVDLLCFVNDRGYTCFSRFSWTSCDGAADFVSVSDEVDVSVWVLGFRCVVDRNLRCLILCCRVNGDLG